MKTGKLFIGIGLFLFVLIIPLIVPDPYYNHILNVAFIYAISVYGFNIISGLTGQLNFAHAGFVGIGAYTSAILTSTFTLPVGWAMLIAVLVTGFFGLIIGFPALRTRGVYFSLTTLGFGVILFMIFENWIDLTGGPMGFTGIPPVYISGIDIDFGTKSAFYYICLFFLGIAIYINRELFHSKLGRAMLAVHGNEDLAQSVGISIVKTKLIAFVMATMLLGLSGSLFAHYFHFISPTSFTITETFSCLTMLVVGGMGTLAGPLIGSVIFTILPEVLRGLAELQLIIYGIILMLCIIFMPEGIVGYIKKKREKA
ncbi:MAG TPA: branched-chain amino acid ABC transporter permease [Syntrophales bacterium]|nr:branched-chain amino acid ABC transporter permease [Syntrophales bacterium]